MQPNKSASCVIGVDLGGTNVRAAVVDLQGTIIGESRTDSKAMDGVQSTIGQILIAIQAAIAQTGVNIEDIAGVGMGVPGTHKSSEGIVLWSPNFKDWNNIQLLAPIKEHLGLPVFMGNDANTAAFGEYTFGAGRGSKCMVMLTLGTGIGSGLIIDGKIYTGVSEAAPEIGHHIIVANGPICGCGRYGCLEALAKRDAIIDRAARKVSAGRKTLLTKKVGNDLLCLTPAIIAEAAYEGDLVSIETFEETGYYIGIGVSNAINILNPDKVVIGGGIAQAGDLLFGPIKRTVAINALPAALEACEILPAKLGDDAGVLGGAAIVMQSLLRPKT
ncbi:MAG: ROK family protein [Armatimonadetes bacterium]|nr:ROK family protein [Armatimonadota bacterium]